MHWTDTIKKHDFELALTDQLDNMELAPQRRVLAGCAIGVELDLAWLSTGELLEAFEALASDIANGVAFLVSDEAAKIHGITLYVDGGISATKLG